MKKNHLMFSARNKRVESKEYRERLLTEIKKHTGFSFGDLFVYLSRDSDDDWENYEDESKMMWIDIDLPTSSLVFINLTSGGEKIYLGAYDFFDDVLTYLKNRTSMYQVWKEFIESEEFKLYFPNFNLRMFEYELGGGFTSIGSDGPYGSSGVLENNDEVCIVLDLCVLGLFFLNYKKI